MEAVKRIGHTTAMMAVVGLVLPAPALRGEPAGPTTKRISSSTRRSSVISDVALQPGGILEGRVLGAEGQPLPDVTVVVFQGADRVSTVQTGGHGQFTVASLRGGVYRVSAAQVEGFVRLWAPKTAPPSAKRQLWIVSGPVARAQMHPAAVIMGSPLLITGIVAAAIAIPVAVHNHRSDRRSGS